tara:strand:- start:144 stop:359 length:216 start_codon:yes stop_codon:yes gene_type:complete
MKVLKEKVLAALPDSCFICEEGFDKTAPDVLNDWHVIQEGQHIGLYCSMCWEHSKETAKLYLETKGGFVKN